MATKARTIAEGLGLAAKHVRERFGLDCEDAAFELDFMYLEEFENGEWSGDIDIPVSRFQHRWGIDLMLISAMLHAKPDDMPPKMREPTRKLYELWGERFEQVVEDRKQRGF